MLYLKFFTMETEGIGS